MTLDADRFHDRKSPRLKHFDYSTQAYYFVTICTKNKDCLFGNAETPSKSGVAADMCLREIEQHFPSVHLDKFVVMPNHIHAILALGKDSPSLSVIVGQYKAAVSKRIHTWNPTASIWQTSYHDHIIRSQEDYLRIWNYIDGNPLRWESDCFYCNSTKDDT